MKRTILSLSLALLSLQAEPGAASERIRLASQVATGFEFSCAITDGNVRCWGWNITGQLGLGHVRTIGLRPEDLGDALAAVNLGANRRALQIALGGSHACAVLLDGAVKCWGLNSSGQLGLGDTVNRGTAAAQMGDNLPLVNLGRPALAVAAGSAHSCALLNDYSVKCWGANDEGQLGQDDTIARGSAAGQMAALLPIQLGKPALAIAAGLSHSCALLEDGEVKCWGANEKGQLGQGYTGNVGATAGSMAGLRPINLGTGVRALALAPGVTHTCVVTNNFQPKCFGGNDLGQLGLGDVAERGSGADQMGDALPLVQVEPSLRLASLSCGAHFCCATLELAYAAKCWGTNQVGQLGLEDLLPRGDTPEQMGSLLSFVDLGALERVREISTGSSHSCALFDGGAVKCWGTNKRGQLGLGSSRAYGGTLGSMGANLPGVRL